MEGWIKVHRKILDNPVACKDADHLAIWMYLLLSATHANYDGMFKGKRITLNPGQLITGRKVISAVLKVDEYKVQRVLKNFENEHQIAQQASNQNRLITILNWNEYQNIEQQDAQRLHNDCTTDAQRVHTNKNERIKECKNERKKDIHSTDSEVHKCVIDYLNSKCGTNYRYSSSKTKSLIDARLNEGFKIDDFKKVVDIKSDEWLNDSKMCKFLRPETLFSNKFEGYLNQKVAKKYKTSNPFLQMMQDEMEGGGFYE